MENIIQTIMSQISKKNNLLALYSFLTYKMVYLFIKHTLTSHKCNLIYNYSFHDNVISKIIKSRKGPREITLSRFSYFGYYIIMKDIIVLLY